MKKRKSSLLQRILAVLLSVVLVTAMVANAAPMTVLAQENTESSASGVQQKSTEENAAEVVEGGYTEQEEGTETEPAEETNPEGQEPPEPDTGTEQETQEPGAGAGQEIQEPDAGAGQETPGTVTEEGTEQETFSGNDAEPEIMEAPQRAIMAAEPAPQADNIASGTDWVLAGDGKLTISSDDGMSRWGYDGRPTHCQNVTSVEIPSGVTSIVINAFNGCSSLKSVEIPSSVTSIGMRAFAECSSLKSVTIPGSVTSIGIDAFNGCSSLESVTIPSSVTSIGMGAFTGCSSLKSVTIPSSVTSIESGAFSECSSLESVTIPESVTSIGASAFENCKRLVRVTMAGKNPPTISNRLFYGSPCGQSNTKGIYVPVCDYLVADRWSSYKSSIVVEAHTGDVSYSASGSRITQKCGKCNTECGTATLSLSGTNFTYTGNAITPVSVTYADSGTNAWSGEKPDDITYADNTNAGTAKASLTLGTGETAATARLSFTIQPKALTGGMVTLPADSFPHTGNAVTPEVTVRDGGTALTKDTDYTVSYTSNSNVGTAAVTVTGKGNYSGAITKNFQIVESDTDKVAAAKTVVEAALDGITATNATTDTEILDVINAALNNAGIAGVTVTIDKFRTFKASASAAGHIEGVISIICGQEAECINMEKPIAQLTAEKYTVTVSGGTGGGEYEAGAAVTITADAPASGKQFDRWVVNSGSVTLADAMSSITTFTMPAGAVSVTAAYKDTAEEHKHKWSSDWITNETHHWHECTVSGCPTTDNAAKGDYGEHVYDNDSDITCNACGYQRTAPAHNAVLKVTLRVHGYDEKRWKGIIISHNKLIEEVSQSCDVKPGQGYADLAYTFVLNYSGSPLGDNFFIDYAAGSGIVTCEVNTGENSGGTIDVWPVRLMNDTSVFDVIYVGNGKCIYEEPKISPEKSGYDFDSWITADGKPAFDDFMGNSGDITRETVFYASWTHTHNLILTDAKDASCTEEGNEAYYVCNICDKWFSDAAGTQEITDKNSVVISKTEHSYDETAWGYTGADGHAHKCRNCNEHDAVLPHTPGAAATESTPQTCTVCGYIIVPATGTEPGTGTVTPEVKPGVNAPVTNIFTPAEELKDMLLTDEEKQQVQNGTDIRIVLEVQDAGNTVSTSDRAVIQQALNGFTVGQYLNIDLYKLVGADRTDITETAKKIRIVITVPDSLKNADSSKTRTFAVIRVHDGRAELLADLDDSADTITIETDRFSTYAVVNKDAANGGSQNNSDQNDTKPDSSKDSEPKTGDNTHLELYATLAMISGFTYLLLYFTDKDRGMTEETKEELVSRLIGWAKRGGKIRKWLALAAIFVLLVYYHGTRKLHRSIGKKTGAEWEKIYEE